MKAAQVGNDIHFGERIHLPPAAKAQGHPDSRLASGLLGFGCTSPGAWKRLEAAPHFCDSLHFDNRRATPGTQQSHHRLPTNGGTQTCFAMKSIVLCLVALLAFWGEQAPVSGQMPLVKPGTCPTLIQNNDTQCGQFCSRDNSCPGSERCCQTGCGQQCMRPREVYPGYCPRLSPQPGRAANCSATCNNDQDCGSVYLPRKKCCSNGCGKTCQLAEEEHPGVCPKRELVNTFAPCNDTCRDDRDCPLTQKCCFTMCSRGCLDSVRSDRCQLPPKTGRCLAAFRRYYYNPSQKKCVLFTYGGCEGNSNNFETKEACEAACGKISPEVCKLPKDPGPCEAYSQFYYYNSVTRKCEIFVYGLCGGNGNRFHTKLECMMVCGQTKNSTEED
ncbi:four-disulfide core domain 3-like [Podarcis lilfordi]|uniref:Four-disulfide core domain 3-like n=1 Tax=Podarcis lilfordi TaxID=74358 RepID=A0AA35PAC0_9SAUR|nr:four-disulfide core domain 3-like [Podarcis lilfordi]